MVAVAQKCSARRRDRYGYVLEHASAELKANREVVLTAVVQNGGALRHASDELKANREVVLVAVAQNGFALECASAELKVDRDVVLAAVTQEGTALRYASAELQTTGRAALLADAAKFRAGSHLVAALQRLAFAACFADAGHFVQATSHESTSCLANLPTDVFELIQQSPVQALLKLELISRTSEQGWAWRSTIGLGLPARVAVEDMVATLEAEAVECDDDYSRWQ